MDHVSEISDAEKLVLGKPGASTEKVLYASFVAMQRDSEMEFQDLLDEKMEEMENRADTLHSD